ncbi:hypothetical protein CBR_g41502 [Chara braunii]|uniref:Uncharacterized protein n=1 Tax=Chara braunii TaxID=69332 RepID=A0A388LWB0_CHABU|nr:hypothetical protein CBR_g41502 [Chara braunii]|eukprot:GBG86509.1 hypothetical protein CBR_g41502 [Chara braunii]
MADVFRRLLLLVLVVLLLLLLVVFHVCIPGSVTRRACKRRSLKKDVRMEGHQAICRSAGEQGGGQQAGQSPSRSSRPSERSGYVHLPPHLQPLPDTSDEEADDRWSRTVPLGSGSTQDWAATACGSRDGGYGQSYIELLQQGLSGDEGDGGVNLSFGLCSGRSSAASQTVIVTPHPDDNGGQVTAVARSSKSPASVLEASGNKDPPRQQFRSPSTTSADHVSRPRQQNASAGHVSSRQCHVRRPPAWSMLTRSQTSVMDQMSRETDEAYQARMLLLITEANQRSHAVATAAKKKAENAEERALLTMAADWRAETENGKMEDSENKIALLLSHLTDLLAACIAQQEDIHNLDDAVQTHNQVFNQVNSRLHQLEQRPVAAPDASSSNTFDRLNALEIDVGALKDDTQLQQTATQQLEQRICVAAANPSPAQREMTPRFDDQEICCDSTKTDPISWLRKFELKLQLHQVSEDKHHAYLYSRSGGTCQAWLGNLLSKYGVVAADLYTKISWDDLKAAWHKRFQEEPPKIKAMDKLMTFEQGTLPSVDWIAKYQRLTSVPDIQMGFKVVKHYFISRSCPALGNALTRVEDTLTTTTELFNKAAQIIVTNKEAKNLHRSTAAGLSRDQHQPKVVMVAVATSTGQISGAVSTNEGDRLAAARDGGRPVTGRGRGKTKTNTASSPEPGAAASAPWSHYGLSEQAYKARTRFRLSVV